MGCIAVIGSGLMGSGIAQVAAQAGWQVWLTDLDQPALDRGVAAIRSSLSRFASKGTLEGEVEEIIGRVRTSTDLEAVAEAEVVVEAVFESLEVKRGVFAELDRVCPPGVVLASNTSAIPITQIASATARPESVVGTHFFSPVPMMRLCELVRGHKTSDETLARARAFAEGIGKTCIVVNRDIAGFVTTRLIAALVVEAIRLVESGVVSPADLDLACELGFGHRMGPLATTDLTGADVLLHATRGIYAETGETKFFPPELLARMVAAGDLGRKSGQGFYRHSATPAEANQRNSPPR